MTMRKLLLVAALAAGGFHLWQVHHRSILARELMAYADSNGFVPIAAPDGAAPDKVVILAALNCPSAQAKRADAMASQLERMGIPVSRANQYSVSRLTPDQMPLITRTNTVLTGEIPIVVINGRAKANPTVDEVAAEFRLGQ